jgi:integrase
LRAAAKGGDPAADRAAERQAETFRELANEYLEKHAKKRKRSWKKDELALNRDLLPEFGSRKAAAIARRDVNKLLDAIVARGAPIQANRTLEILRRIFNWGMSREIVHANPCHMISPPGEEHAREKVLSEDEIRAFWAALGSEHLRISAMFRLRLLTAQRGGEVSTMRREDLDLDGAWWTIPGRYSKNGLPHRVPLSPWALEIVKRALVSAGDSPWVFPSPTSDGPVQSIWKAVARIRGRCKVDFRPHDLRRTAASLMTGMGISRLTVAKILNHVESSVTAVYDRHSYDAEKRAALDAWARRLEEIIAGKPASDSNVTEMRRA